jgi:hypothetical protein
LRAHISTVATAVKRSACTGHGLHRHQTPIKTLAHPFVHYGDASYRFDDLDITTNREKKRTKCAEHYFLRRMGMYMLHFISHHVGIRCMMAMYLSVYVSACSNQKNSSLVQTGALFALYVDVLDRQMCVVWRARATMHFVSRKMSNNENKVNSRPWVHADDSRATHQARGTRRAVALHKPRPGANCH